jgi:very-short-patch-repair endonuclease
MRTFTHPITRRRQQQRSPATSQDLLWQELQGGRLGGFRFSRHCPVGPHFVDFACHARRVVIEIEAATAPQRNHARDVELMAEGYSVFRVPAPSLEQDLEGICLSILAVLQDRLEDFANPPPRPLRGLAHRHPGFRGDSL